MSSLFPISQYLRGSITIDVADISEKGVTRYTLRYEGIIPQKERQELLRKVSKTLQKNAMTLYRIKEGLNFLGQKNRFSHTYCSVPHSFYGQMEKEQIPIPGSDESARVIKISGPLDSLTNPQALKEALNSLRTRTDETFKRGRLWMGWSTNFNTNLIISHGLAESLTENDQL